MTTSFYWSLGVVETVQWHMYCVAITFNMTEQVEQQWICIKFCVKLEHSLVGTIWMIHKVTGTGNWWLAASSQQYASSCLMSAEIFGKMSNCPGDSVPLQPRFGALWLLASPKTKITFEKEDISDCWWDSGKYDGAADGDWENCVRSQGTYIEGDWGIIVLWTMFLVSCIFFNKYPYFHITWLGTFGLDLIFLALRKITIG